ncbi:MAG: ywdK, partial [Brevibacillus sp.]|nr:ywdK [Brevibacillus sp.]
MKLFLMLGSISGFLSVALGAFGAHALKEKLDEYSLGIFHTGVTYQTTHALAMILVAFLIKWYP